MLNKLDKLFLNKYEKKFIKSVKPSDNGKNFGTGYFLSRDYRFLALFKRINEFESNNIFLFVPKIYFPKPIHIILVFPYLVRKLYDFLIERKWIKMYSSFSDNVVIVKTQLPFNLRLNYFFEALKIWRLIKEKHQLNELKYKNLHVGYLIYDTYLRFYNTPKLKINSIKLLLLIYSTIKNLEFYLVYNPGVNKLKYFTPYTSYISSGTISLGLLYNLNKNISLYTCAFPSKIKKLNFKDFTHSPDFSKYKFTFSNLNSKEEKLKKADELLKKRFEGKNDLSYMRVNVYEKNKLKLKRKYDGVIFLHDFLDAPHSYGKIIFNDFYEWTTQSFDFILKNNLNIGVKFHPNQTRESEIVVNRFIKSYPKINWIDPKISNKEIFKSGIKFGISVFGTVLSELAYHNITPVAAGSNPFVSFNFVLNLSTKKDYFDYLLNPRFIKIKKNEILEFYYINHIHNVSVVNYLPEGFLQKIENEIIELKDLL